MTKRINFKDFAKRVSQLHAKRDELHVGDSKNIAKSILNRLSENPDFEKQLFFKENEVVLNKAINLLNTLSVNLFDKSVDGDNKLRNFAKKISAMERKLAGNSHSRKADSFKNFLKTYIERGVEIIASPERRYGNFQRMVEANLLEVKKAFISSRFNSFSNKLAEEAHENIVSFFEDFTKNEPENIAVLQAMQALNSCGPETMNKEQKFILNDAIKSLAKQEIHFETKFDKVIKKGMLNNLEKLGEFKDFKESCTEFANAIQPENKATKLFKSIFSFPSKMADFALETITSRGKNLNPLHLLPQKQAIQVMAICTGIVGEMRK